MAKSPKEEMEEIYNRAALKRFAKERLSGDEMNEYRQIVQDGAEREEHLKHQQNDNKIKDVNAATLRLQNKAGSPEWDLTMVGRDKFAAIREKAIQEVNDLNERELKQVREDTVARTLKFVKTNHGDDAIEKFRDETREQLDAQERLRARGYGRSRH